MLAIASAEGTIADVGDVLRLQSARLARRPRRRGLAAAPGVVR
jgi:hypothetical protein